MGKFDVLLHHLDPSGLQTFIYTHPGIPAYMGMNSGGLCVLWMYIDDGKRQLGVPTNALICELLCRTTLEGALGYLERVPRTIPKNFLLAYLTDGLYNVELSPRQFYPLGDHEVLYHANHILGAGMAERDVTLHNPKTTTLCATPGWLN